MRVTYTKLRSGHWGVRAEGTVRVGDVVTVSKKDGTEKREVISHIIWEGDGVTLCAIESARTGRSRSRYSRYSRYEGCEGWGADNPHPPRDGYCLECAEMNGEI